MVQPPLEALGREELMDLVQELRHELRAQRRLVDLAIEQIDLLKAELQALGIEQ